MDDLNNKLREILDDCAESYYPLHEYPDQPIYTDQNKVTLDRTVAQIHQAYKEAGYAKTDTKEKADQLIQDMTVLHAKMKHDALRLGLTGKRPGLYSGQEWYDRFSDEVMKMSERGGLLDGMGNIKSRETIEYMTVAAKKASGIS